MKTIVIINSKDVSAINDVLGTYGSERRIKQICKSIHGITISGVFINDGGAYALTVEIPMLFELCKIARDHAPAIKGLIQAINGIKDTINYIGRNISRDIKNLFKEYE